ncbi:protein eva-1-like isoform X2 [Oppia nitens]|uniref:protein eva-1-like isoform X2 n=1 Tax=Oppia nitens TaxID=1686743 RepID=UPI0023D9C7CA|nr:protein eva-1-like isoform X2 [Oppia nitens]
MSNDKHRQYLSPSHPSPSHQCMSSLSSSTTTTATSLRNRNHQKNNSLNFMHNNNKHKTSKLITSALMPTISQQQHQHQQQQSSSSSLMPNLVVKYCLVVLLVFSLQSHQLVVASNLRTLRTFQVHACDGEELRLECPTNTVISIYFAQYGSTVPSHQLCPALTAPVDSSAQSSPSTITLSNASNNVTINDTNDCLASDTLRYSLLQKVESSCREQRICKFMTSPQSFGGIDPCPGVRKYAEIAFKCRPNTFYNRVVCEGDRLRLKCHRTSRIVIYSATFGSSQSGVAECPQLDGGGQPVAQSLRPPEECMVSYATETVMSSCHGRKKCSLDADIGTFGEPGCSKATRLHLKVVYTCVPRDVLKELDIGVTDSDKNAGSDSTATNEDTDDSGFVDEPRYIPEHEVPSSTGLPDKVNNKKDINRKSQKSDIMMKNNYNIINNNSADSDVNCTLISPPEKVVGFISDWISAVNFIKKNTERFILYLLVSLCGSLVCFLVVLSSRLFIQKRKVEKKVKEDIPVCSPFGVLTDDNGDDLLDGLEGVTTLTEPLNLSHNHSHHHTIQVVRYGQNGGNNGANGAGNSSTMTRTSSMRRQNSDTNPRSLSRSLNNYYYN